MEIRLLAAKSWRKGVQWRTIPNGYEISFWDNEDALDAPSGDGCTTL